MDSVLFNELSENEVNDLKSRLSAPVKIKKSGELYKTGYLGLLCKGKAQIKRKDDIGQTITVRSVKENDIFGSASLFGNWKEGSSSIIADTDCEIIYISQNDFITLVKDFPKISLNYIKYLTDRIKFLNRRIDSFTAPTTMKRLYEFLLLNSDNDGNVKLNFGMSELARRLNVGRTSLYRDISSLEEKNLIKRNGKDFIII